MNDAEAWLRKAYPVPASDPAAIETELAAAQHSLNKWLHLRPEVLKEHGLRINSVGNVHEIAAGHSGSVLNIDSLTCALCERHDLRCNECSLKRITGQGCNSESPWGEYVRTNDPEPMIAALQQTVDALKREQRWTWWWHAAVRGLRAAIGN